MRFDFISGRSSKETSGTARFDTVPNPRVERGRLANLSGQVAEDNVKIKYLADGYAFLEQRWRGRAGELDLIFEKNGGFVFVEVKASQTCARAAESLSAKQLSRICASAQDYIANTAQGLLSDMRIDVALVDAQGKIEIIDNATV